jgi:orotate phosphoribosyltransferase
VSVLAAVDALKAAGAIVVGVAVIVERGAKEKVESKGLVFLAAFSLEDLCLGTH